MFYLDNSKLIINKVYTIQYISTVLEKGQFFQEMLNLQLVLRLLQRKQDLNNIYLFKPEHQLLIFMHLQRKETSGSVP